MDAAPEAILDGSALVPKVGSESRPTQAEMTFENQHRSRWGKLAYALPWIICAILFVIYNLNARFIGGSDVYATRFMPVMLAKNFSYYFPQQGAPQIPWNLNTIVDDPKSPSYGKVISVYPTYMPTLLFPIYFVFYNGHMLNLPPEHFLTFYLDKWVSALVIALTGALTFSLIRRLHGGKILLALLVTAGMSLGTSVWAIASQGSWAMGPSAFFLILSVWSMERAVRLADQKGGYRYAALAGFAIASAFCMRLTDILFVLPFFLFGLWELRIAKRARHAWIPEQFPVRWAQLAFFGGIVPVALWFIIHNYVYFGHILWTGYKYNMVQQRVPNNLHPENFAAGFIGLLFSPSLGMLTMGPVTIFSFFGMASALRTRRRVIERRPDGGAVEVREPKPFLQRVMYLCVPFTIAHILVYSCYLEWWGGWSFCYRYLIDIQPFLALCTAWFFRPGARLLEFRWPLYVPALIFSAAVQFYGAFIWGGGMDLGNMPRFYLNLDPKRGYSAPFNHDRWFYRWTLKDHFIANEMNGRLPSLERIINDCATPRKIYCDLFVEGKYSFNQGLIIIYQGKGNCQVKPQ